MKLWLLGACEASFATALQEASGHWPNPPSALVLREDSQHASMHAYIAGDLLVLLGHSPAPQQDFWRAQMASARLPFQVLFGESTTHAIENLRFAWSSHVRSQSALRPEIRPRWTGVCESCSDPDCEHRLFSQLLSSPDRQ